MVISRADASAHRVRQALLCPDVDEKTGGEATPEKLVHDRKGIVVGVVALNAEIDHADITLVDIILLDKVDPGSGFAKVDSRRRERSAMRHGAEGLAQTLFHRHRIKVSGYA